MIKTPVGALALACLAAGLGACGGDDASLPPEPTARPVKLMTVEIASGETLRFPGVVAAGRQVDLSFRVGGPLIDLAAAEGESLARGSRVARIDPRDFRIAVDRAQAQFDQAELDIRRISALYEKSAVSKAQLDQARAAREIAQAGLDDAQAKLSDNELKAPFSGQVGAVFVENFQDVRPGQPILSLVAVRTVEIQIDVPESIVARLRDLDQPPRVVATFEAARGVEFPLEGKEFAAQADPRSQTYRATLLMAQPDELNVLPGMTAEVIVYSDENTTIEAAQLKIPAKALLGGEGDSASVWLVDPEAMTVSRRQVTTGDLTGTEEIFIVDGLTGGETIAISGVSRLREGMVVRNLNE
ncbi:MAG: efflux RND transporter periplasmic adaptor subunit [Acidobacteriota bacterium]